VRTSDSEDQLGPLMLGGHNRGRGYGHGHGARPGGHGKRDRGWKNQIRGSGWIEREAKVAVWVRWRATEHG
jgi:hypothetical protein